MEAARVLHHSHLGQTQALEVDWWSRWEHGKLIGQETMYYCQFYNHFCHFPLHISLDLLISSYQKFVEIDEKMFHL